MRVPLRFVCASGVAVLLLLGGCGGSGTGGAPADGAGDFAARDATWPEIGAPADVRPDAGADAGATRDLDGGKPPGDTTAPDGPAPDLPAPDGTGDAPRPADAGADAAAADLAPGDVPAAPDAADTAAPDGAPDAVPELPPAACRVDADCTVARGLPAPCTAWDCDAGVCVGEPATEGAPCDDGDLCTAADRCTRGRCVGSTVRCEDDGLPCTVERCEPAAGCTAIPVTGLDCDDGDPCTEQDRCMLSKCLGQPVFCDDGDPCTADGCDPVGGGCVHAPLDERPCDDGDPCTTGDTCHAGLCAGLSRPCDDGDPCTRDACDPATGACGHTPAEGRPCDDHSVCTLGDHCAAGRCVGRPLACNDGNPCTADTCDPAAGCLHVPTTGSVCDDGNPCTDRDRCAAGVCLGAATACDDGNPCTLDACTYGSGCTHREPAGFPCDDGDACTAGDRCLAGVCTPGLPVGCDDGNVCTADGCDPAAGCVFATLSDGACDDGDACTAGDHCAGGVCLGAAVDCGDPGPCAATSCDPAVGCVLTALAGPCDDGDPCTAGDFCAAGLCEPGPDPECLAVQRVVLAGDSWSAGLVFPTRDALDGRGYEEVTLTYELTVKPGTTVAGWLADPNLMAALFVSLDVDPPADILFFTLSGNDYLHACRAGLGLLGPIEWFLTMTQIQWDLQTFVALAQAGRPNLKVVLIGYDYLNYFVMQAFGFSFPGLDWVRFNVGMVDLAERGRNVAAAAPNMVYAHNMGLLQHTFGDAMFGYGPGVAPKPGPAPGYDPFPGGWFTYPSPAVHIPDGIHPDYEGFRALIENAFDQGPAAWIEGRPWP